LGYAEPVVVREFVRLDRDAAAPASATVAEEVPVALVYNGRPHVVMMCTPADIDDFALGFSLTEEIVTRADAVASIRPVRYSGGIEVDIAIPATAAAALADRGRALVGRTGCGLCGVTTIADALRAGAPVAAPAGRIGAAAVFRAADSATPMARARFMRRVGPAATASSCWCARTSAATMRSTNSSARWRARTSIRPTVSPW
jgi:formate dehydrogenase assembly factor FdhD